MKSFAFFTFALVAVVVSVSAIPTTSPSLRPTVVPSLLRSSAPSKSPLTSTPSGTPTPVPGRDLILNEGLACLAFLEAIPGLATLNGKSWTIYQSRVSLRLIIH